MTFRQKYATSIPPHDMWQLIREFMALLRREKKWWIIPLVVLLLIAAALMLLSGGSAMAPFMYPSK